MNTIHAVICIIIIWVKLLHLFGLHQYIKDSKVEIFREGSIDSVDPGWINNQQLMIAVEMITVETIAVEMITVEAIASCVDPGGIDDHCSDDHCSDDCCSGNCLMC